MKQLKGTIDNESKGLKKGDKIPQSLINKDCDYAVQARELQRLLGTNQEEVKAYDAELIQKVVEGFCADSGRVREKERL